jgi:hypothetical protein
LLHEEVNRESMQLAAKIGKVTYEEIKKALEKLITELKTDIHKAQHPDHTHGKQSLKELAAQNAGLSSIELTDPNLRQLNREMKKCGIDFAPVKSGKGEYLLFFKGRDADAMTHAFEQYTKKIVKQAEKPSIRKLLATFKDKAAQLNAGRDKAKNHNKGGHEL